MQENESPILVHTLRSSPSSLTTLPEILSALSSLQAEELELSDTLSELLSSQEPILQSLASIQALTPRLDELHTDASLLSDKVSSTARTAERVGGRVRALDEEMRRVKEASERVGQVMELKTSLSSLQEAMENQDWESATRHCARAMTLPDEVISGPFAETAVPTTESHLPPAQTLQGARDTLLEIFRRQFNEATVTRDAAATTRFFKLFPAIGWEAEGLEAYAAFVIDLVKVRPPASAKTSSPLYYITSLTALFESIAMIIDQHQPVVEKYYGAGKMASVIVRLLQECDRVAKGLTESWEEERLMKRKLTDIANNSITLIAASPVTRRQPAQGQTGEDEVDAREIDKVISEIAGMSSRWHLFRRFLYDRLKPDIDDRRPDNEAMTSHEEATNAASTERSLASSVAPEALTMVDSSACNQVFDELLNTYYTPLEVWYTRSAIEKAHRLSTADAFSTPAISTTPDDAFYIFKNVLTRLISTGSPRALERTSILLRDVIERDYAVVIKRKLDDVYRSSGAIRGERAERESRLAFITLLNDLDISSSHMERLIKDILSAQNIPQIFLAEEVAIVQSSISAFTNLVPKFRSVLRSGVEQLFNQLLRPKMRSYLTDLYKDVSYVLNEDVYNQSEYQDVVHKRFVKAWENLVEGYKDTFTEGNFELLFGMALDVLIRPWEKYLTSIRYSELGAIRLDRDLRAIITYLSSQTAFGDVREKFVRLQQIATIANLDQEEDVDEFYSSSGIPWKLTEQEARTIAGSKV